MGEEQVRFDELLIEREAIQKRWHKDGKLHAMHLEILQLMMKESIQIVENIETNTKYQKEEIKLKIKDVQLNKLREQIMFRDELLEEARHLLKSAGNSNQLQNNRILPLEDIMFENQVVIRDRGDQNSRLTQATVSPARNYGSNSHQSRKMAMNGMFGANNNNYVDRLERLEMINGKNRDNHYLGNDGLRRNGSEQRFINNYSSKKNSYNGVNKGSTSGLPTALQNQFLLNNHSGGNQSTKNLHRGNQASSGTRQLQNVYASKKTATNTKNNRGPSKYDRNVVNAKAYLNN